MGEWLWKGGKSIPTTKVEAVVAYPEGSMPLRYRLCMTLTGHRLEIVDEAVENQRSKTGYKDAATRFVLSVEYEHPSRPAETDVYFFYRFQGGNAALNVRTPVGAQAPIGTDES
jgi:hypothetical protein